MKLLLKCLRRRFTVGVTILAIGTLLGCGSSTGSIATEGSAGYFPLVRTTEQEFGQVYLTRFPGETTIEILPVNAETPLTTYTTNAAGAFKIPTGTALPAEFRVSAQTPEGVRVERYVEDGDKPHLFVNIISTIISNYKRLHPELTLAEAEARVRSGLSIDPDEGIYAVSDSAWSPFSHALFIERAEAFGGLEPFMADLVGRIEQGETLSFRKGIPIDGLRFRQSPTIDLGVRAQAGEIIAPIAAYVGDKILSGAENELVGKVNAATGLNLGSSGSFSEVNAGIATILDAITNAGINAKADWVQNAVYDLETEMGDAIDNLKGDSDGSSTGTAQAIQTLARTQSQSVSSDDDHGLVAVGDTSDIGSSLAVIINNGVASTFSDAFTSDGTTPDHPLTENLFYAVNDSASRTELGGPAVADPRVGDFYSNGLPMRRDDIVEPTVQNFDFYFQNLQILAQTLAEYATTEAYLPTQPSTGAKSNSDTIPSVINSTLQQINALYGPVAHTGYRIVAQPVGCDTVITDSGNGLQWYLGTYLGTYDEAQNTMIDLQINNWKRGPGVPTPSKVGDSVSNDLANYTRSSDMAGWRLPERTELEGLRARLLAIGGVPSNGTPGDTAEQDYKNAMDQLGFVLSSSQDDDDNYKKFWYNGSVTRATNGSYIYFNYYDMITGKYESSSTAFSPLQDSVYSYIYCRSLNYSSAAEFGDTGEQDINGYGYAAYEATVSHDPPLNENSSFPFYATGSRFGVDHQTDVTDEVLWSIVGPDPDIAFITYAKTSDGKSRAIVNFRGAGTATVRISFYTTGGLLDTVDTNVTGSAPFLTDIDVTSKNMRFGSVPLATDFYYFYCTGYLSSGEVVDLTSVVDWTVDTPIPAGTDQAGFSTNTPGNFLFGDPNVLPPEVTVRATYNPGDATSVPWRDDVKGSLTETSTFGYSTK